MAATGRQMDVQLSDEEYALLEALAEQRDSSVSELIRQAIRQVYMNDVERDLTALEAQRLGEESVLMDEEGGAIGIRGRGLLAEDDSLESG